MTRSEHRITSLIPTDGYKVTDGAPVDCGTYGPDQDHMACPDCITWVFTRITGINPFVNVQPAMVDDTSCLTPFFETMTNARMPCAPTRQSTGPRQGHRWRSFRL